MKKLINYFLNDFKNPFFYYVFGFFIAGIFIDLISNTYLTSVTGPFIIMMFLVLIILGYGDVYGQNAVFVQTLPYNRGKILTAKWIFQSILTFLLTTSLALTLLIVMKPQKNVISENLSVILMFFPFIWIGLILMTDLGQLLVYIVLKIQRKWLKVTIAIVGYSILTGIVTAVVTLALSNALTHIEVILYWICGLVTATLIVKAISYVLYKKIDIPAVNDTQNQINNLYGGRY